MSRALVVGRAGTRARLMLVVAAVSTLLGGSLVASPSASALPTVSVSLSGPASAAAGDTVTLTANVDDFYGWNGTMTFTVDSGPHAGTSGVGYRINLGTTAQFSYTGSAGGTDVITASYYSYMVSGTVTSQPISIVWSAPTPSPTPEPTPTPTPEPTPSPTPTPTPEPTPSPTPEPTASTTPTPSVEPTVEPTPEPISQPVTDLVALDAPTAGQAATYEASMEQCVDRCTFDWFVDGVFVTSTAADAPADSAGITTAGAGGVLFTAVSRVQLTLAAGSHDVIVHIGSADGTDAVVAATFTVAAVAAVVAGPEITPPPTSTIDGSLDSTGWIAMLGLSLLLIVGALAAGTMFNAPITTVRRRR
jgi:hypothetical protein